ncbi:uncharacterized protein B0P05DRAFT_15629 [Gilbertella persicaria]|uniref:uncharacterized protein n=1 Tax=Gilbertella persicaria TaxID=101096 RepID=UPI00221E98C1|nr:uncharacterized protein B0P05DRAFT_15629 [Gilbertella persicaria]KAI8086917.1 hypothetical protein B0P05DRAFT_15629 [Gilbertella persicaria]
MLYAFLSISISLPLSFSFYHLFFLFSLLTFTLHINKYMAVCYFCGSSMYISILCQFHSPFFFFFFFFEIAKHKSSDCVSNP